MFMGAGPVCFCATGQVQYSVSDLHVLGAGFVFGVICMIWARKRSLSLKARGYSLQLIHNFK